jgi:hypothetical protein
MEGQEEELQFLKRKAGVGNIQREKKKNQGPVPYY